MDTEEINMSELEEVAEDSTDKRIPHASTSS